MKFEFEKNIKPKKIVKFELFANENIYNIIWCIFQFKFIERQNLCYI